MFSNKINFRYLSIIFITSLIYLTNACDISGNLKERPKSFASPGNFYSNPDQIRGVFAATMDEVWGFWEAGYDWSLRDPFQETDQMAGGDLVIEQNHGSGMWNDHFANIKELNFVIRSIQDGKLEKGVSDEVKTRLMAQARFLRGWNYFQLVRMFGGLPLYTEEQTDNYYNVDLSRSPVEKVYELIVSDFQAGVDGLPSSWPEAPQTARPNSFVAKAFLAKAYLTMATAPLNQTKYYQNAANLTKEIIDSGKYALVDSVDKVFSFETENGPEMMWEFQSNAADKAISPQVWSDMYGWGDQSASTWWTSNYPEQPRKHAYIQLLDRKGKTWQELGVSPGIKKYQYDTWEDIQKGQSFIQLPIMRYADVLLMYAEAANMNSKGPTQEAVDAVNKIIDRANGYQNNSNDPEASMSMSESEFDKKVIYERNLELCFEYDRWFDIIRKRLLPDVADPNYRSNFKETDYLWPIPEKEMRLNPKMEQNPGY